MWFVIGGLVLLALVAGLAARRNRGGTARGELRDHGDHAQAHLYSNLHAQQNNTMGPF
ncbi:hypothetical protein GCM10009623_16570 [Nocardioides aestuarii]|uniref:LPXTG cell wall anchor domain-containing protein n=1 Tax=Nocardioides aestuarii TaxID=252231 RepID=A0ABW4TLN5_9ACTN